MHPFKQTISSWCPPKVEKRIKKYNKNCNQREKIKALKLENYLWGYSGETGKHRYGAISVVYENLFGLAEALFFVISSLKDEEPDFKNILIESSPSGTALLLQFLNRKMNEPKYEGFAGLDFDEAKKFQLKTKKEQMKEYSKSNRSGDLKLLCEPTIIWTEIMDMHSPSSQFSPCNSYQQIDDLVTAKNKVENTANQWNNKQQFVAHDDRESNTDDEVDQILDDVLQAEKTLPLVTKHHILRFVQLRKAQGALRRMIKDEACLACQKGSKRLLQVCHVLPFAKTGYESPDDVILLCLNCHRLFDDLLISFTEKDGKLHVVETAQNTKEYKNEQLSKSTNTLFGESKDNIHNREKPVISSHVKASLNYVSMKKKEQLAVHYATAIQGSNKLQTIAWKKHCLEEAAVGHLQKRKREAEEKEGPKPKKMKTIHLGQMF